MGRTGEAEDGGEAREDLLPATDLYINCLVSRDACAPVWNCYGNGAGVGVPTRAPFASRGSLERPRLEEIKGTKG